MRKRRLLSFLVLLMIAVTSAWAQEKVAYAVWDSDATTLTFKYDANKPQKNAWVLNEGMRNPGWINTVRRSLTKVVFDQSFADARPTTLYQWFNNCTQLTEIEGMEYLNASEVTNSNLMFRNCSSLTSITLPNDLTTIGQYAFSSCSALTSINIPESVTSVGENVFQSCSSLTEPLYNSKLFVYMPRSFEGSYTIPNGITTIVNYAFYDCQNLTEISIPEGVTTIDYSAFQSCYNLASINIPESVTSVGSFAFAGIAMLKEPLYNTKMFVRLPQSYEGSYTIPDGITTIASTAFNGCNSLNGVTIPASTLSIGEMAFYDCSALTDVFANPTTPPTLDGWSVFAYNFNGKIYVPLESVEAYKTADRWMDYQDKITDNQPRVYWATGANTENWTITVDGQAIVAGETPVTAGKTVTVEYSGTRTVDLIAAVTLERQGNKWTFAMPDKPATLNSILGEASVDGKLYSTFNDAINASEYGSTVKLEYDVVLPYNVYIGNQMTLDLNGYAISASDEYCHFYLYPWNKLTVTDTSKEQKGGFKIKMEPYYYGEKLQLELMAGRYVFTADEINTNGYNGYGFVAENINTDASADADGYISKLRVMTPEEKVEAAYNINKITFTYTLEDISSVEMSVIKDQEIRLTPPAGWKFGKLMINGYDEASNIWSDDNSYSREVNEYLSEIVANLVPDPNKLVDKLEGITLTQSDDKTSLTLKGAGGKTVALYAENGAKLMSQAVEDYKVATFKGLPNGKIYYIGVNGYLIKIDTNL